MIALVTSLALLTGCATVTNGRTQPVSIQTFQGTAEIVDARCTLVVGHKAPVFVTTPGTVPVRRSSDDLVVTCRKDEAGSATETFKPTTSGATAGNVLLGASLLVGLPMDLATGAAFKYPDLLRIELRAVDAPQPPAAPSNDTAHATADSPAPVAVPVLVPEHAEAFTPGDAPASSAVESPPPTAESAPPHTV